MTIASDFEKIRRSKLEQKPAKILTLDIETSPNLAYIWGLWDQNVPLAMLQEVSSVICFAAKWYGEDEVLFHSDHVDGHEEMVYAAWDLINQADIVIHFNGKAFDMKHLNREFLLAGLGPTSPYKDIDLLTVVKGKFKFVSNKLDHVAQQLGVGSKTHHTGFELWRGCMNNDADAWALMEKYNKQDVVITEGVYDKVKSWINNHPVVWPIIDPAELICPIDGSSDLVQSGVVVIGQFEYDRYICNECGAWYRSKDSNRVTNLRKI